MTADGGNSGKCGGFATGEGEIQKMTFSFHTPQKSRSYHSHHHFCLKNEHIYKACVQRPVNSE